MGSTALKSVDSNIILRYLLEDDATQTAIATNVLRSGIFIPITVLLEIGWVLGSLKKFDRATLVAAFTRLVDMDEIHVADEMAIREALGIFASGGDFSDAIHLVAARGTEAFVTFDKGLRSNEAIGVIVELAR